MTDTTISFGISGLHCASCVGRAEAALAAIPGARAARVNLANHSGQVGGVAPDAVMQALDAVGYPAEMRMGRFYVPTMSCASCIARIEAAVSEVPGTVSVRANLADHSISVQTIGSLDAVRDGLTLAGYPAQAAAPDAPAQDPNWSLFLRFALAALLTLPVFVAEMGGHLYPPLHHWIAANIGMQVSHMAQLVLTAVVLAGPGAGFFKRGIPGLLKARPDMDALVALGAGAAFGISAVAVLAPALLPPTGVYFEAAAVIVTLILLGRWLEARARGRTGDAVRRLIGLRPDTAEVVDGAATRMVPVDQVIVGDLLRIRPGGRVAVDGIVTEGQTHIDESMLTGEPVPVLKSPGDTVSAGTLASTGTLTFRATHVGRDTVLARIAVLTEQAQSSRLPVEEVVNKITGWFVPVVLLIASITFFAWLILTSLGPAVVAAVSVLIIACPCAMGLATPMSIMVGTGRAAELGVLFHKGAALQRLQDARVIAFDKTGTLTEGAPRVTDMVCMEDRDTVLRLAAGVESRSEHPIARAIAAAAKTVPEDVHGFEATLGEGAMAQVEGRVVCVGNAAFLDRNGIALTEDLIATAQGWAKTGVTAVHVAVDGTHAGVCAISDPIREGAAETLASIAATGRKIAMISGDAQATADHVGKTLGIDIVIGNTRPDGKVDAVNRLRQDHGPIAFVGDGINDAPALAAADVGLAVNGASDVAIEAADVVLMSPDPGAVLRALSISQATLRNIWQNLSWAFGYNTLLIPVAAGVLVPFGGPQLSPALAALAMALSSVFVVSNALRLKSKGQV
ncbi:copper-translocating P-type ATPase [uncultured Tateyamaria sp.]|uniref:heavy metal translocating P-type ATPase n=1 Tax=uncultured Tateyamaria sp. TaxID=455651 RepID=UPI002601F658|nr:copper-translocating P-type ATPase [uncultured Tateyamaria sp.]